jgi:hypothetical protein
MEFVPNGFANCDSTHAVASPVRAALSVSVLGGSNCAEGWLMAAAAAAAAGEPALCYSFPCGDWKRYHSRKHAGKYLEKIPLALACVSWNGTSLSFSVLSYTQNTPNVVKNE